ncbi:uncharacterized protein STEHIDRAFT_66853 [Stereum hirsutum FP-91666 SS1]|uniref:uncharacterized protein n=1 Tax=Stereum hirsutum (strain FP-91666) TaxID=721885 RepID=UPI000444A62B|nr:uncharacterized protein STEHIDRAFT_66853 [Stereum hirsutum FP-91666 SS1]EIM81080.1 hypothetical protein STEHIDRAFT_66853 [Stereum hirsutum FP-91666 SS1]
MASANSEQPRVPSPNDQNEDYFAETLQLRAKCRRFRILVIGRANAGKTTLCQRMCNTTDPPVVYTKGGKIVNVSPSEERGIHNIEDEIVYEANPGFVFHDSGGFESGSEAELQTVRDFIKNRSEEGELSSRLHAIWFCMPVDSDRPLVDAEMKFFDSGTHPVPVIAIFTKCDSQYIKAKEHLREKGISRRDITKQVIEKEIENYLRMLETDWNKRAIHPPKAYCFMKGNDHKNHQSIQCAALVERTEESIDDDVLKLLFASVQRCNTKICVRHAVKYSLRNCM